MTVLLFILWGIAGYLACRVAYNQGRKDKWNEIARDYICFHKSVNIKPLIVTVDYELKKCKKFPKESLTKTKKSSKMKKN